LVLSANVTLSTNVISGLLLDTALMLSMMSEIAGIGVRELRLPTLWLRGNHDITAPASPM